MAVTGEGPCTARCRPRVTASEVGIVAPTHVPDQVAHGHFRGIGQFRRGRCYDRPKKKKKNRARRPHHRRRRLHAGRAEWDASGLVFASRSSIALAGRTHAPLEVGHAGRVPHFIPSSRSESYPRMPYHHILLVKFIFLAKQQSKKSTRDPLGVKGKVRERPAINVNTSRLRRQEKKTKEEDEKN